MLWRQKFWKVTRNWITGEKYSKTWQTLEIVTNSAGREDMEKMGEEEDPGVRRVGLVMMEEMETAMGVTEEEDSARPHVMKSFSHVLKEQAGQKIPRQIVVMFYT